MGSLAREVNMGVVSRARLLRVSGFVRGQAPKGTGDSPLRSTLATHRRRRSELTTTSRLLTDIVAAAKTGVSRPAAATGTATRL